MKKDSLIGVVLLAGALGALVLLYAAASEDAQDNFAYYISEGIMSRPLYALGAIAFLWPFLYVWLTAMKLTEADWKRLEFVWILAAGLGLLNAVFENNKLLLRRELRDRHYDVDRLFSDLSSFTAPSRFCGTFIVTQSSSPEFVMRANDHSAFCDWSTKLEPVFLKAKAGKQDTIDISSLDSVEQATDDLRDNIMNVKQKVTEINKAIMDCVSLTSDLDSDWYSDFRRTVGVLAWRLLLKAFYCVP